MSKSIIEAKALQNEAAAYAWVEARVWPNGPVCPHCSGTERISKMQGKATRIGLYKCYDCRKQFTVKIGTIFEGSHVPMNLWLQAMYLLCSSKKGISSNQLQRTLGVTLKTAWFMAHRIREAMAPGSGSGDLIGGAGKTVEADETYLSKSPKSRRRAKAERPVEVVSLVERGGPVRSIVDHRTVRSALREHLDFQSKLMTDGAMHFKNMLPVGHHETVDHSKFEWVRDDVHTNTLEGFFSILKRGLVGTYQHVDKKHLHRYLAEFDFRYNNRVRLGINDLERTEIAIKGIIGKRLTYRTTA